MAFLPNAQRYMQAYFGDSSVFASAQYYHDFFIYIIFIWWTHDSPFAIWKT